MTAVETPAARCRRLVNELELQLQRTAGALRDMLATADSLRGLKVTFPPASEPTWPHSRERLAQAYALCDLVATARAEGLLDLAPDAPGYRAYAAWIAAGKPNPSPFLPTASEALYLFMGALTTRDEVSGPFSSSHDANQAAELVGAFCAEYGLRDPRPDFHLVVRKKS